MTRQVYYVFFGVPHDLRATTPKTTPHESAAVMTTPLVILAVSSILLGLIGTPVWPWFKSFLDGEQVKLDLHGLAENGVAAVMLSSTVVLFLGLGLGWWFYGRRPIENAEVPDVLERFQPQIFDVLRNGFFIDRLYETTIIRFNTWFARACDWLDRWVWGGAVQLATYLVLGFSHLDRSVDAMVVNPAFDQGCRSVTLGGRLLSRLQNGQAQSYLRIVGIAFAALVLFLLWGKHG
jgi:NADH-quinone oxidoreductase subunit L